MNDLTDFPNDTAEDAARLVEIIAGVYAWIQPDGSWWINNAGAVSDGDEVLIIDHLRHGEPHPMKRPGSRDCSDYGVTGSRAGVV